MLTLYEHSTSVCVIKVRLTLLEKGIDYEGRIVDLRRGDQFDPEYRKIHPGAVVPALIHDGETILESSVIQYYLEDAFPEPSLMPADPVARYRVRLLMKTIDDPVHPAAGLLTHAIAFRKDYRTPEAIEARMAKIPDPRRRARQRAVYEEGLGASLAVDAVRDMEAAFARMDETLAHGRWLGGDLYSLADAAATPYANRMNDLGLFGIWTERHARVADWFDRVRARPSYRTGIADWVTDDDRDRMAPVEDDAPERVAAILAG